MTPDAAIETGPGAGERVATAPLGRRLLSMTYEAMLLFAVVFVADYLFDTLTQSRHGLMLRHARQGWLFIVVGAYFVWFWLHGGQTLAMKTWRIRLVRRDGGPVDPARAVARYLLLWIFVLPALALVVAAGVEHWATVAALAAAIVLPPFYALVDPDRQFVHDRLLGTRLVVA
jgi:uncharacterized RDD family membrane protein YckC